MSDGRMTFMALSALFVMALWTSLAVGQDLLRDPTRPPAAALAIRSATEDGPQPFALSAVIFAEGRRLAIINGERVREQDRVGSARVVRIDRSGVRLERGSERIELRLVPRDVKGQPGSVEQDPPALSPPATSAAPAAAEAPAAAAIADRAQEIRR